MSNIHGSIYTVLCGCGSLDGTEISESISTAIHLCQRNIKPQFYAPDVEICGVINHLTGELDIDCPERNALAESARLARSCIKPLCECYAFKHAALILPGGLGAGADCTVIPDLEKLIEDFYCEKKPIGSMCISSVLVAKVLKGVKVTLGRESPKEEWPYSDVIKKVRGMGSKIEMKGVKGVTRCKKYNVFSTPAWLYERATYSDVHQGIGKLVAMLKKHIYK